MDKTNLVKRVAELLRISDHEVQTSVIVNHREIDILAKERNGLSRKTLVIECADYRDPVGVKKIEEDLGKLRAAIRELGHSAVPMHVSRNGYTPDAAGLAASEHLDAMTFEDLASRLVNFDEYLRAIEADQLREIILKEYQPTKIHFENERRQDGRPALDFVEEWLNSRDVWLTVLGDYGVGKSWMLKRVLYWMLERYRCSPNDAPLPFFIPLQSFTKAFTFQNLIVACLQRYGVRSVNFEAVKYLAESGRIVFLFDSFDEMAQILGRSTVRENLKELLEGVSKSSRAIMTSRPTYFESRSERLRLVDKDGTLRWESIDKDEFSRQAAVSAFITSKLEASRYARLNDLTSGQRRRLFETVLSDRPQALKTLLELFSRFQSLESLSQRAVIARLLTTVAETLAKADRDDDYIGRTLSGNEVVLNESKIFEIVVYNLLERDRDVGELEASARRTFLHAFAVYLQQPGQVSFASPEELRQVVSDLFEDRLRTSDSPQQLLESLYRSCRRHSGLTTERQFLDTSGSIDTPVDENDQDSRVGFSHNSLREYLVASSAAEYLIGRQGEQHQEKNGLLKSVVFTDGVADFLVGIAENNRQIEAMLADAFSKKQGSRADWMFRAIYGFIRAKGSRGVGLLGSPPSLEGLDLSSIDLSGLDLQRSCLAGSIAFDTDFRKTDFRNADMGDLVIERAMFDEAKVSGADFTRTDLISIYVYDDYDRRTSCVLSGREARQWLHSRGAKVKSASDLNPYLGKPWYEASREVVRTLVSRVAGTHEYKGLVKGTKLETRPFAQEFREFLIKAKVLEFVKKDGEKMIYRLAPQYRGAITEFSEKGVISDVIRPFFDARLKATSEGERPKPT